MLDFICTYYRFSIDGLPINRIKKLMDFNQTFAWDDLSVSHAKANTRNLAIVVNKAKVNNTGVTLSMLTDSLEKCKKTSVEIAKRLSEVGSFQREMYKGLIRKDIIENPDFHKDKAYTSSESEIAEIKRLFPKVMGKKPYYSDLIGELVNEDVGSNKEKLRQKVLDNLQISEKKESAKVKNNVNTKEILMGTVLTMGAFAPILVQIRAKVIENFDLLYAKKESFFTKLIEAIKTALNIKPKERICNVPFTDAKTGATHEEKIVVNDFIGDIEKKIKLFNTLATKSVDYGRIENASEESILSFVNKQLSEVQSLFTKINALDPYFKNSVEGANKLKVKGMKIDLDSFRNTIITVNKKRSEYISVREEAEQLKKLGFEN